MQFGIDFLRSSLAVAVGCRESWLLPSSEKKKKTVVLCWLCGGILSATCRFIFLTSSELTGGLRSWDLLHLRTAEIVSPCWYNPHLSLISPCLIFRQIYSLILPVKDYTWGIVGVTAARTHFCKGVISFHIFLTVFLEYDAFFLFQKDVIARSLCGWLRN